MAAATTQLTQGQGKSILEMIGQLRHPENSQSKKLVYSETEVCLETYSSTWRTTAEYANWTLSFIGLGSKWNRNLENLPLLVEKAVQAIETEIHQDFAKIREVSDIYKHAKDALSLYIIQYKDETKIAHINKAFETLKTAQERLFSNNSQILIESIKKDANSLKRLSLPMLPVSSGEIPSPTSASEKGQDPLPPSIEAVAPTAVQEPIASGTPATGQSLLSTAQKYTVQPVLSIWNWLGAVPAD